MTTIYKENEKEKRMHIHTRMGSRSRKYLTIKKTFFFEGREVRNEDCFSIRNYLKKKKKKILIQIQEMQT